MPSPIVDLSFVPIELQAIEYNYRLQRAKRYPKKAVKVQFKIHSIAREVAESDWFNGIFFLAS